MDPEPPVRPPRDRNPQRSPLTSPLLAVALLLVAAGLVGAILLVPGLLPSPGASATPLCPGGQLGCPPAARATPTVAPSSSPSTSALPTFVRPTPTPQPTFINVVVKADDSLNTIAQQYRTTARSIAWWNRGTYPNLDPEAGPNYSPGHIEPGWVLVLIPGVKVDDNNPPTPSPGPPTRPPTASPTPASS